MECVRCLGVTDGGIPATNLAGTFDSEDDG
jgi:hypothetical protein